MNHEYGIRKIEQLVDEFHKTGQTTKEAWEAISEFVWSNSPSEDGEPEPICNCIIKHAITSEEQASAFKEFGIARSIGDTIGAILCLEQLRECPTKDDC